MAKEILMQKGTALWLAKKTKLTNTQIAAFCNLHEIEVNAYKLGLHDNIIEFNPLETFLLTEEMIVECEKDPTKELEVLKMAGSMKKGRKNISYAKKHEVINAILWLLNKYPKIEDDAISKLLKCTKNLVRSIKEKTYKDYENLIAKHPVVLNLCTQEELDKVVSKHL